LNLQDTYYDSADWMIFRAGYALRVRRASVADQPEGGDTEITLKSLQAAQDGLAHRTEISESVGNAPLQEILARHDGIGERIRKMVGQRPLTALFQARTRRERQHLLEADSDLALAEVDLDETSIESPGGRLQELRRVEVECINAEPGALSPLVEQLRDAAQLQPVELSKFRAGLAAAGLDPAANTLQGAVDVEATQPFELAQLALLRRYFLAMTDKEAEVRAGSATAVHEMRVAGRHLEVLLRAFRGRGPSWAISSRPRIHGLIKALGAVRDADVQWAFLDSAQTSLEAEQRAAFEPVRARLQEQQAKARTRLFQALDSPAVQTWQQEWREQLKNDAPAIEPSQPAVTAIVARELVREAFRKLCKRASRIEKKSTAEDYHEVRIRAKRLRYTLDAFASLYGGAAEDFGKALAKLQTVLGNFHDATVREQRFTALVADGPRLPSSTSFVVGRMVERDTQAVERCREKFPKTYRRVHKRRWRELSAVMKRVADAASPGSTQEQGS
jgi:CHAD domain-containing protein